MDDFREVLSDELSLEPPPPALGGLVEEAARAGRRTRRLRRWAAVAGSVTAVAVVATLLGLVVNRGPAGRGAPVALDPAAGTTAPASPRPSVAATTPGDTPPSSGAQGSSDPTVAAAGATKPPAGSGEEKVPATTTGLLEQLLRLLPPGRTGNYGANPGTGIYAGNPGIGNYAGNPGTGNYAGSPGDAPMVQTFLTTQAGTGIIRVSVYYNTRPVDCRGAAQCLTSAAGHTVRVTHMAGNCIQDTVVEADHGDGTSVQLALGTCLNFKDDGSRLGVQALTVDQAVAIAGDPALGLRLDPAVVKAGAVRFVDLPDIP
ncbi:MULTISPECIES: hypothetical protein [Kitasatospora]